MGLFTNKESPMDGMSEEAKKLAADLATKGGTATLAPPAPSTKAGPILSGKGAAAAPNNGSTLAPPPRNLGVTNPAPQTERQIYFQQLKVRIHQQLVERLDVQNLRTLPPD